MAHVKQIVGLDLGTRTVRAAWVTLRGGTPQVLRVEQMVLPADAQEPNDLILAWLKRLGLAGDFCAIGLPGAHTVFQTGRLAPNDPRTPRQAADMELATFNEMAGDTMRCSVVDCEWSPGTRLYLMAMVRPAMAEQAIAALDPIQLRAADLVPVPVAVFNALDPLAGPHDAPFLYINIGHLQTDLAIGSSKCLLFSRTVAMGGKAFTDAISRQAKYTVQQAEVLKHRDGSLDPDSPCGAILKPVADRLVSQIASAVGVYRGSFRDPGFAIGQIVLSGGGAQLRGIAGLIGAKFDLPVLSANDLADARPSPGAPPRTRYRLPAGNCPLASYDVAIGLALTAYEAGEANLSLLPSNMREEIIFREKKPYWIAAAALLTLTLGIFAFSVVHAVHLANTRMEEESKRLKKYERIDNEIAQIKAGNEALRKRVEPLMRLLENGPRMRLALSLAANAIGPNDWISMICEEQAYLSQEPAAGKKAKAKAPPKKGRKNAAPDAGEAERPLLFLPGFRGGIRPAPPETPGDEDEFTVVEAEPGSPFDVFIVEGYTPDVSLASIQEMVRRLLTAPEVKSVDLLSDALVRPPSLPEVPDDIALDVPNHRRFVLRMELERP
ncbi:MAG: pilus assembly protein PilM [Kiritimatiellia bacterium]|jgi:Tfp pilus assembly PilM family ATPase